MTEKLAVTAPEANEMHEEPNEALAKFSEQLVEVGEHIPEIAENAEAITEASQEIIEQFGIMPELFEDQARVLVFAAIASEYSKVLESNDFSAGIRKKEFITDAIFLLARKYTDEFEDLRAQIDEEDNPSSLSERAKVELYNRYTDDELSREVTEAIEHAGLLDGVKGRLGITSTNEDKYRVRVLSIGDEYDSFGIEGEAYDYDNIDWSDAEQRAQYEVHEQGKRAEKEWKKGLAKRKEDFIGDYGVNLSAPAWVSRIGGETYLCINMPLAEKLLHPEVTQASKYYDADERERDLSILEHEYVHTQGGLIVDGELDFGIALEERRAEYFSGDNHGYRDVKHFVQDLQISTGFSLLDSFDQQTEKGGSQAEIFTLLARELGLDGMLETLMALPQPYDTEQTNSIRSNAQGYLGGLSSVSDRIFENAVKAGGEESIVAMADKAAVKVANVFFESQVGDIDNYSLNRRGGKHVNKLIDERAKREAYKRKIKSIKFNSGSAS